MKKHFIDLDNFTLNELRVILNIARDIKLNPSQYTERLKQKSLGMLFEKQSNRTRVSFDIGMKKLGGNVIELNKESIGFGQRESESDVLKVLSTYIDCLMIRNDDHNKMKTFAEYNHLPIINGLSDYSHPCQILSDIFTIEEAKGSIENLLIVWCGDINNVLISLLQAAKIFNFQLHVASPETILQLNQSILNKYKCENIHFFHDPFKAIEKADCIMTDVWISMGKKPSEAKILLFKDFQINDYLLKKTNNDAIFMHCLPACRNLEVTDSVIDGKKSIVWQQAQNRLFVQQSILNYCIT